MIGDTATTGARARLERLAHAGHGEDRLDADEGVGRTDDHRAQRRIGKARRTHAGVRRGDVAPS